MVPKSGSLNHRISAQHLIYSLWHTPKVPAKDKISEISNDAKTQVVTS